MVLPSIESCQRLSGLPREQRPVYEVNKRAATTTNASLPCCPSRNPLLLSPIAPSLRTVTHRLCAAMAIIVQPGHCGPSLLPSFPHPLLSSLTSFLFLSEFLACAYVGGQLYLHDELMDNDIRVFLFRFLSHIIFCTRSYFVDRACVLLARSCCCVRTEMDVG